MSEAVRGNGDDSKMNMSNTHRGYGDDSNMDRIELTNVRVRYKKQYWGNEMISQIFSLEQLKKLSKDILVLRTPPDFNIQNEV